jgi:hypothetical protein
MRKLALLSLLVAGCAGGSSSNPNTEVYALKPFTIAPGEEQINCYYSPATGVERYVSKFDVDMNAGSHHLILFRVDERGLNGVLPPAGPTPCTQLDFPKGLDGMMPGSQQRHFEVPLPEGVAMKLEKYHGLYFQSHYINATRSAITTQVKYQLTKVDPENVQQIAGMIFYSNLSLNIPPGMSTASKSCHMPADANLLMVSGHMHMHGLTFDATVGDQNVFHTDNWDEPNAAMFAAPGLAVAKGTPIGWSCSYDNQTGDTIVFGNSASKNEMCILGALYYPSNNGQTFFGCQ